MSVVVRRIRAGEGDVLRRVRLAALRDAPFAFGSTYDREVEWSESAWGERALLGSAGTDRSTFFAMEEDDPIGIAGGYRDGDLQPDVELVSMWTAPAARRRGVGRELVRNVLDWADATGAGSVGLWVTRGNEPAQALYESMGFEPTGDHQPLPSDPCKDELRMVLRLATRGR